MAESVVSKLLSLISPKEAEAKIVGSPEAMGMLRSMYTDVSGKDDYLSQQYKRIIERANNIPQTVEVNPAPGLADIYSGAGSYEGGKAFYDPQYKGEDAYNNIAHELLHFLSSATGKELTPQQQHDVIKILIGTSSYKPANELRGYTPPQGTSEQEAIIKSLFGE